MSNSLRLNQISTSGNDEGKEIVAGSSLAFVDSDALANTQIAEIKFDDKKGLLVFIKKSGKIINISGLPTAAMFGEGKEGAKGAPGKSGRDGRDGRDGSTGTRGNTGQKGERGKKGKQGEDGIDGPDGDDGYRGNIGNEGAQGEDGAEGPDGPDGPAGEDGPSCIAGPTGPTGPAPSTTVLLSGGDTPPTNKNVFAWCYPINSSSPMPPLPSVQSISGSISNIDLVATRVVAGHDIFYAQAYLPINLRGGTGPYKYKWNISSMQDVSLDGTDQKTVHIVYNGKVDLGKVLNISGTISCTVMDMGQSSRPQITVSSVLRINAKNPK